jgi:hypothetical protein
MRRALLLLFLSGCALGGGAVVFDGQGDEPGEPAPTPSAGSTAKDSGTSHPPADAQTATDAAADVTPVIVDAAPDVPREAAPTTCTATFSVVSLVPSSSGCTLNEEVRAGSPATMTYPCAGGAVTVRFGSQTFSGTVSAGQITVTNVDQFPFSSCTWESTQRISGTLASGTLSYSYSERVVAGGCSGVGACTASGSIAVQ